MAETKPDTAVAVAAPKEKAAIVAVPKDLRGLLRSDGVVARFTEIMKSRAPAFMTSILNVTDSTAKLQQIAQTNGMSIIRASAVAAALDLPIEKSLGFAWIVPYGSEAQFQIGWKGLVQLALRTGQYAQLTVVQINEGAFRSWDMLNEQLDADYSPVGVGTAMGFAAFFRLVNGFQKLAYYDKTQLLSHGQKYSKAFRSGPWQEHQDEMCAKTALKLTLGKWGIMSIDLRRAVVADQAIVKGDDIDNPTSFAYDDNAVDGEFTEEGDPKKGVAGLKAAIGKKSEAPTDLLAQCAAIIGEAGPQVTEYGIAHGWIKAGQAWKDAPEDALKTIAAAGSGFMKSVSAFIDKQQTTK